jgi:hypothetical protein
MKKKKAYQLTPEELDAIRPHLFTPCKSKEALHAYILLVLGLDLPDGHIDPSSNSSPMELVWELYDVCMKGGHPDYSQLMAYSAREGIKTLAASVFEVLSMVHLGRNVVHGAAIKQQSKKSQEYVKRMLGRPLLRDFVTSKNDSILEITRYVHNTSGESLNPTQFAELPAPEKGSYEEAKKSVVIVVATVQSMNGQHEPNLVLDELDVFTDMEAYEEGKNIPTESEDGGLPLTLMTSTRKYAFGIVQREIDNAEESGLLVRHWNIIDVTSKCQPERHLPNEPQVPIYFNEDILRTIGREGLEAPRCGDAEEVQDGDGQPRLPQELQAVRDVPGAPEEPAVRSLDAQVYRPRAERLPGRSRSSARRPSSCAGSPRAKASSTRTSTRPCT